MDRTGHDNVPLEVLPEEVVYLIMSFWDVPTLVQKKAVCHLWQRRCTSVIDSKAPRPRKALETNTELCDAVTKYTRYNASDADTFATSYGWPIDSWDVSRVQDFSSVFDGKCNFNETINSWDVSNATTMMNLFRKSKFFNQDLSSWNTSNVTEMYAMFRNATSFSQDISSWNTANVTDMSTMFSNTTSFNQDISSWNTSN
eukprot:scaffold345976_cov29-Attheya_sp.AAC.1